MDLRQRRRNLSQKLSHAVEEVRTAEHEAVEVVKTLTWSQLEEWQKDNEYIVRGYRRAQNSWKGCFQSIFGYLHNETVNIHSHLFGAALFLVFLFTNELYVIARYPTATWTDSTMCSIFIVSAILCLTCSSVYHVAGCHSEQVEERCHALDYSGIVILIVGSFFPAIYYAFYCDPFFRHIYLLGITLAGLGAALIVLNPEYSKPTHRGARTKVFIALGLSSVIPVTHALFTHGLKTLRSEMGVGYMILSGALYIFGALLYANRIPERFSPGTFDYFFASHQIFHVMVVLAALAHYAAVLTDLEHWHGRRSVENDIDSILELVKELAIYEKAEESAKATPELIKQNLFTTPFAHALLAVSPEGQAIGLALYFFNFSTWTGRPGLYLEDLFVMPEHRSKGIGKAFFAELARVAQEKNCARMDWAVLKWNKPSIDFYEKALGAFPMSEWMGMRLEEEGIENLKRFSIKE